MTKSTFSSNRGLVSSVREAVEDFIPKIEFEHMGVRYCTYTLHMHCTWESGTTAQAWGQGKFTNCLNWHFVNFTCHPLLNLSMILSYPQKNKFPLLIGLSTKGQRFSMNFREFLNNVVPSNTLVGDQFRDKVV